MDPVSDAPPELSPGAALFMRQASLPTTLVTQMHGTHPTIAPRVYSSGPPYFVSRTHTVLADDNGVRVLRHLSEQDEKAMEDLSRKLENRNIADMCDYALKECQSKGNICLTEEKWNNLLALLGELYEEKK